MTTDQVISIFNSNFERIPANPSKKTKEQFEYLSKDYTYSLNESELQIYFTKKLKRKIHHSFQVIYPEFKGNLIEKNNQVIINGNIGRPEWTYILAFAFLLLFTFFYLNNDPEAANDGEFLFYFILYGILSMAINIYRTNKKVNLMKSALERLFTRNAS